MADVCEECLVNNSFQGQYNPKAFEKVKKTLVNFERSSKLNKFS
jgi:hypothetical protein